MTDRPGEHAETPRQIPARGWLQIAKRAFGELGPDHVGLISAGVAFYGLMALFPAITALLAISGLILEPADVTAQFERMAAMMPEEAARIVLDQAVAVAGSQEAGLGLAAVVGIGIALYSASKGVGSLIEGLNVAYDEEETRGLVRLTLTRIGLTVFLVIGMICAISATLVLPGILTIIDLGPTTEMLIGLARWAVLFVLTVLGIAILYRVGPDRRGAQWRWVMPGAIVACVLWIAASIGFSIYVENFASYNESFGALSGVIILLMWLWLSSFVVLLGAELNGEAEAQTRVDTTTGRDMPAGARGAVKADTVVTE